MKVRLAVPVAVLCAALAFGACGSSGSSASSFCNKGKDLQKQFGDNPDFTNKDTAKQAEAAFKSLADSAPSEIKADMQTMSNALNKIVAGDTAALQADATKIETASNNITKYLKDKCGINTTTTT